MLSVESVCEGESEKKMEKGESWNRVARDKRGICIDGGRTVKYDLGDVYACMQYSCIILPRVISHICIPFPPSPSNDD